MKRFLHARKSRNFKRIELFTGSIENLIGAIESSWHREGGSGRNLREKLEVLERRRRNGGFQRKWCQFSKINLKYGHQTGRSVHLQHATCFPLSRSSYSLCCRTDHDATTPQLYYVHVRQPQAYNILVQQANIGDSAGNLASSCPQTPLNPTTLVP
ncbi:hypothetical protein V8G54_028274 [Vigna mungo]|uniref:Uncharacterized protein n=1 Tax=Vigna mungo TaxID=3915 RepID=A0AAQ3RI07_VIGMU